MRQLPTISVVTPSFNVAQYLEQTIRSVLDQNYPNLEYVVIDAGSKDGSVDIIRKYADRLTYWVSEPDKGHADGINKGFLHTTGDILCWINASDAYYPWTLQWVGEIFADLPHVEWMCGLNSYIGHDIIGPVEISSGYRNKYDFLAGHYDWMQQESMFWRRSLWEKTGSRLNVGTSLACDFELWLRFFRHAELYEANTILGGFRYHGDSRGVTQRKRYYEEAAVHFKEFYGSFGTIDHLRAKLIGVTHGPRGRIVRRLLRRSGLMGWYRTPRIVHDVERHQWVLSGDSW